MKKLVIILAIVLSFTIDGLSQRAVFGARVFEVTKTQDWKDAELYNISSQEVFVIFDYPHDKISITNNDNEKFLVLSVTGESNKDGEDILNSLWMRCIDAESKQCTLLFSYYDGETLFANKYPYRIRISYGDVWYGYYMVPIVMDQNL